ncbi:hypothetical protein QCA50_002830 [Cerrena zonata]|uniref:Uncharacterized protein n=1 Tax=Cerrena zonata TaxID=2478898 RepID=A0AAW0GIU1_9APHY
MLDCLFGDIHASCDRHRSISLACHSYADPPPAPTTSHLHGISATRGIFNLPCTLPVTHLAHTNPTLCPRPSPALPISRAPLPTPPGAPSPLGHLSRFPPANCTRSTPPHPSAVPRFPSSFYSTRHLPRRPASLTTMPSSLYVPVLVAGMLITGSSNSLWSKWQDMQCVENCDDPNPRHHVLYEQPIWQTLQMFLGEMLCFLPVILTWLNSKRRTAAVQLPQTEEDIDEDQEDAQPSRPGSSAAKDFPDAGPLPLQGWNYLLFWFPAICDLTGTTVRIISYSSLAVYVCGDSESNFLSSEGSLSRSVFICTPVINV